MTTSILDKLIALSRSLGDPINDYVILGEGNTSAKLDDGTFWVKASGTQLRTIDADGFVRVSSERVLAMLDGPDLDDDGVRQGLINGKVDPQAPGHTGCCHALAATRPDRAKQLPLRTRAFARD